MCSLGKGLAIGPIPQLKAGKKVSWGVIGTVFDVEKKGGGEEETGVPLFHFLAFYSPHIL